VQGGTVFIDPGYRYTKIVSDNPVQSLLIGGDLGFNQFRIGRGCLVLMGHPMEGPTFRSARNTRRARYTRSTFPDSTLRCSASITRRPTTASSAVTRSGFRPSRTQSRKYRISAS